MATSSDSSKWQVMAGRTIPYGHPPRTLRQKIRKVNNTILFRLAYGCPINSWRIMFHRWRGCHIGKGVYIGRHCFLDNMYPEYIYIYDGASINAETMILTHFNPYEVWKTVLSAEVKPVVIGENAIVSVRSTIMPGVVIGKYSVVSAGMVIEKSIGDYTMVRATNKVQHINIQNLIQNKPTEKTAE